MLVDTQALAFMLRVTPNDIRHWASRHPAELARRGTSHRRALYDVDDALKLARRLHPAKYLP